ncbi:MAG: hypothetical protein MUP85_08635, partial [Candidatus Lokiarchaeota archaeon]|nr:hypothetical protein [Candidatus Lokiarchaeota archaeon]
MVVPISNSKNYVICPFCGNPELLSERSEEQANKEIRICKHCGQEINTRKKKRENDGDTSLLKNFYFQMSFLTYREIYHILKNSKISEKNVKSLDLTEFEISKIVDQVRRETINGSFLVDLKEKFPRGQFPQIRRLYQEIREEQQQEQLFQDELRIHFEEATMDMFSIFCGDQSYYELTDIQKRIITNIIQEDGFNPEDKDINNSFNQQVWLHAASYIHHILIERENVSYSNSKLILSPIRINEIAQEFTDFFTGDQILEKWNWKAIKLKNSRLEKELKSLQSNLKRDWIFRESFVAQAKRLIIFITHLIRGEIDINLVKDLEKKIVEKLSNDLNIDNNSHISSIFKFNFMLVITRFVYFILRTYPNGPPLGENLMDSEDSIEQKITWYIKREMLKSDSVKESFLRSLHEMKINDFNEVFSKIKRDIKKDFMFSISFNMYLESIITQVIKLISTTKKKSQHSLDERAIIENLANYNFQWNVEKNPIFNYSKNKDSFGNTHKEAQMGVMKVKESIYDKLEELKDDDSYAEGLTTKVIKSDIFMGKGIIKKGQKSAMPNSSVFNINIPNFREVILKYIEEIVNSIECSDKQKKIILSQSETILDNHISRAKKGEITIPRNTGVIANASAIIYAVIVSNECMPKITGKKLSELAGVSRSLIPT